MNENEKMELNDEQTSALTSQEVKTTSETQTDANAVCEEKESPALEISEAADAVENSENAGMAEYHKMSKQQLVDKMKEILAENNVQANREANYMKQCFFNLRKAETDKELEDFLAAGNQLEAFSATPDALENEFQQLLATFKEKRAAWLEAEENRRQENLAHKLKAIEGIRALMEDVDNINRNYAEFQKLQQEFKDVKDIPPQAENDIWSQYQKVVEEFYDLLKLNKELRDLDFKKNLEAKRSLIERAKELAEMNDVIEASRQLQALHQQWREIGPVAKEIRDEIWDEFRAASSVVNRRHQEFFERRKAEEQKNEEEKTRLCEEVEALDTAELDTFAKWDEVTEKIKELQAKWKTIGFASRKSNNALYARFRKTIDDFFSRKTEFYKSLREEFRQNLQKKNELCEEAEKLMEMENLNEASNRLKELQEQWKTIGGVDRRQSDIVWRRFRKACNTFFEHRRKQGEEKRSEENANLAAKQEVIAALKAILAETEETGDSINRMRGLQDKWRSIGFVPFTKKEALQEEYRQVVASLTDKLKIGAGRRERMSQRRGSGRDIANESNPRAALNDRIRARKSDLQTYENNLGFFNVKSSAGNSMVKELQNKIERIKKDIADLEAQLKALDTAE